MFRCQYCKRWLVAALFAVGTVCFADSFVLFVVDTSCFAVSTVYYVVSIIRFDVGAALFSVGVLFIVVRTIRCFSHGTLYSRYCILFLSLVCTLFWHSNLCCL